MSFPVIEVSREPADLYPAYSLSDYLDVTKEQPKNGALIRFIPAPPHPERDLVLGFFGRQYIYTNESTGDSETILRIFGLWLPEQFEAVMESREECIEGVHLFNGTTRYAMNLRGQTTPEKIAIIANNYFEHRREMLGNAASALNYMPASLVHIIQAYMA